MRLYFIFLLSIILLTILPVKSSIIIEEPQSETAKTPRVLNTNYYDDGTIVVRIVRLNYTAPSKVCVEERLTIRTIYPNGTVKGFDLSADTLNIQPFNFCLFPKFNPLRFYPVKENYLFLTYAEAEDVNNPFTYNDWGMIIDLDGVIKSKIKLGASFVNTANEWLPAQDSITLNVHRDNGFLRTAPIPGTNSMILQQFKVNENGEIQSLAETYMNYTAIPIDTVATMDGGYAIIYPDYTPSTEIPLTPYMAIRGFFLENGNPKEQGPFVLYQTSNPVSDIILLDCDFTKVGFGQTCIVVLRTLPATNQNTFIKIDFLSSGTVYNITIFQNPADLVDFAIVSLDYGGYLLYKTEPFPSDMTKLNLYGYIVDDHGNHYNWNIPYPTVTNFGGDIVILPNNTLAIPQPESGQSWSLTTTDLYKIEGAHDHGYGNLHIFSTTPNISDIIDPSEIKSLTIQFYNKVDLSPYRSITILQDGGIIRQITSVSHNNGEFVRSIDDYTVEITVIDSTFNQPDAKYYVLIDDGFVKSREYQEPIIGILDNAWNFMTIPQEVTKSSYESKVNASSIDGKVRLTAEGTAYFKSFKYDKIKVKEFFDNLTRELAKAIPVGPERITTNGKHEIDTSASSEQYILSINVKRAKNKTERSVNLVASDLDTLIKNKLITVIGSGEYTNYLDEEYGYEPIPRWTEEHLGSLLGTIAFNVVLLLIACLNKTFAIYTCGNAIEKFVTTILFTSIDAESVENIFTTSLFFVTFPFIVNLGFAIKVVNDELLRNDLSKLLDNIRGLKNDLVKEGNNSTVKGDPEKNITNIVDDHKEKVKKLTKVLRETRKELVNVKREFTEVSVLTKEFNELIEKLKDPKVDVKTIKEKLEGINNLIEELTQVEDFTEELIEVWLNLNELDELLELNIINPEESKESKEVYKEKVTKFMEEIDRNELNEIMKGLKVVVEFRGLLYKAVDLMNGLKEKEPTSQNKLTSQIELTSQLKKLNSFKIELEKISNKELKEEKEELNDHTEFTEELEKDNNITKVKKDEENGNDTTKAKKDNNTMEVKRGIKDEEKGEERNRRSSRWEEVKRWSCVFIKFKETCEEEAKKQIEKGQPKKYRKISTWLKDYKDNQIIVIIFTILAGVDTSHLELLGSKLRIRIPSINYCGHITRNVDVNFNAKLSHAAEESLLLGGITNIFIEDISAIFIQCFYLVQVVSFRYTPIYTISKSIIHLATNLYHIYQYKRNSSNTNTDKPNDSVE